MLTENNRLYFVDWLRAIALAILWFYHTALIFNGQMYFHVLNAESIPHLYDVLYFFHQWRLGLLFFISGVGTYFAIKKYRPHFIKERVKRLLIPLLFGVLVIVPPQIYYERLFQGFSFSSYLSFYAQSFTKGLYPYGDISWHHLWFLAYLFLYGLIVIVIYKAGRKIKDVLYKIPPILLVVPLIVFEVLLKPISLGVQNIVQDMAMFVCYFLIYTYGIIFASNKKYFISIEGKKHLYLLLAIVLTIGIYVFRISELELFTQTGFGSVLKTICTASFRWFCILAIVGYAAKFLNKENKFVSKINPGILPLYLLHQTFIVAIGYWVIQLQIPPIIKLLLIVISSLGISLVLYFYVIKKLKLLRILFGIEKESQTKIELKKSIQ
jgi:glucan biosynthesis protein C